MSQVKIGEQQFFMESIRNLDEAIDILCESLGENHDPSAEDLCPYYGLVWPSAIGLTMYLMDQLPFLKNKTVLELGCGLALPSIYLAQNQIQISACDFHPDVEAFLKRNFKHNTVEFPYFRFNWRDQKLKEKYDYVIGSDILYESKHPADVAYALKNLIKPHGKIILADPGRGYLQTFLDHLKVHELKYELIPYRTPEGQDIFVFEISAEI